MVTWSNVQSKLLACVGFLYKIAQKISNGACAHYVMVSKFQWKPFWLATQLDPHNDWTGGKFV